MGIGAENKKNPHNGGLRNEKAPHNGGALSDTKISRS
jgi:hypothetical protein